jgi:hypothetical protein
VVRFLTKESLYSLQWEVRRVKLPDRPGLDHEASSWPIVRAEPYLGDGKIAFLTDARAIGAAETLLSFV